MSRKICLAAGLVLLLIQVAAVYGKSNFLGEKEDRNFKIIARLITDEREVEALLGVELKEKFVAVEVELIPKTTEPIYVSYKDFELLDFRHGARTQPYTAAEIFGGTRLIVAEKGGGPGFMSEESGPIWGGMGGGMPQRIGGPGMSMGSSGETAGLTSSVHRDESVDTPIKKVERMLFQPGKVEKPSRGYLFFPVTKPPRAKDAELLFTYGASNKIFLRFHEKGEIIKRSSQ